MVAFAGAASALSGRQVQLWLLPRDEERLREQCRTGIVLLSGAERDRLDRFSRPEASRRFLLGRVLMRRALATYLGVDAASLVLVPGPLGKPGLVEPACPGLAFNLSHSRSEWAFALAQGEGLGVDLEPIDRTASVAKIACGFYSHPERQRLRRRADQAAAEALQPWTLKEAVVKSVGEAVWQAMQGVQLGIKGGRITWLAPPPEGDEACWSIVFGRLRQDHWLALVLKSSTPPRSSPSIACYVLDDNDCREAPFAPQSSSRVIRPHSSAG